MCVRAVIFARFSVKGACWDTFTQGTQRSPGWLKVEEKPGFSGFPATLLSMLVFEMMLSFVRLYL